MFKKYEWRILVRVALLFITLCITAYLLMKGPGSYVYLALIIPVVIYELVDFYRFHKKAHDEVSQFVESVHYRDFSRHFDVKHAPLELQPLRRGFNDINTTFKVISKERETQYQYLQKILELVDTGILSYDHQSGDTGWMNESLKKMLGIPYLKTIHSLEKRDQLLYHEIISLRPGEGKVVQLTKDKNIIKVLLSATAFQTDGKIYKLIAFQNVDEALDENEAKAWQKLLSVMTHEIMNSVAPISSLADTLKNRLQLASRHIEDDEGTVEDLELGIITIKRRSEGLLKFAETYRNLNKITTLNLAKIYVRDLFETLFRLMQPSLQQKNIDIDVILKDPELVIEADVNLMEQVMINLLVNAMEAVKDQGQPHIVLSAYKAANQKVTIKIADNGSGIPADVLDKIFIPFFSTKKSGSGIGLSLCKQIMMLHKGNVQVQSTEGEGTAFLLIF
ncbi:sensor histidine kinase [Agriterribacter humi]|jgi:signal transduction histidine kinase|uniref:sensor histidine kinase n=1 Tax=Agriterribacter humi TaxID=1104781 RepID=UPI00126412BF|nr:HAMP domain-containing sensor histidine kinase [Agriterribacter humi]